MSEMIGAKKNNASGLSPEFENNPYEKLDDLLFDANLEFIVSVEDNYLKQALAKFLLDNNLQQKTKNHEEYEYMFISLDLGTFNFIEKPNYEGKNVYDLPYDWNELLGELRSYISENPFEKKEIEDKNPDSWSTPRTDTPNPGSKNDGKSFLERAKEAVSKKLEKPTEASDNEKEEGNDSTTKVKNYNSVEELKEALHKIEDNSNLTAWSSDKKYTPLELKDDGIINNGDFDEYSEESGGDNPFKISSMDYTAGELTMYIEIKKPFKRYVNDEYGATEYIEFENGDTYRIIAYTPAEPMEFDDSYLEGFKQEFGKPISDSIESVSKIVDELIV